MRVTEAGSYDEKRDAISHDWIRCLEGWNMAPMLVPNVLSAPAAYLAALGADLLVLTGGDDPGTFAPRDNTETALLVRAIADGLPVLGICRGMQIINLHFGGGLVAIDGHATGSHKVAIAPDWQRLYDAEVEVNSFHNMAITGASLADPLTPWAWDGEGGIEGLCHPSHAIAAVMWHPERTGGPAGDSELLCGLAAGATFWR